MRIIVLPLLLSLGLAACGNRTTDNADANVDADSGNSIVDVTSADGKGEVKLNLPGGIGASLSVPKEIMAGARMEIGGVGLYPGAKIGRLNVKRQGEDGLVAIVFTAPAEPTRVADWYQQQFAAKDRPVARDGTTLTGTTEDGDPFTLAISADGNGARGVMTIRDKDKA